MPRIFNRTVFDNLPTPKVTASTNCSSSSGSSSVSKCVLLCSVMNVTHVSLSWYKGKSLLSSISVSDLNIRLSLPLEVEYQDTNTYRCVVSNPVSDQTTRVNIKDVCPQCSEPVAIALILGLVALAVVIKAAILIFICCCCGRVFGVGSDEVKSVMEGDSVTLNTHLTHIQRDDQILWQFVNRGTRIAEINTHGSSIYDDDERFKGKLQLNSQTGSLTITNITITDSGLYKQQQKNFLQKIQSRLPVPVIIRDSSQCSSSSERSSVSICSCVCFVSFLNLSLLRCMCCVFSMFNQPKCRHVMPKTYYAAFSTVIK
ncbi:hypothetical protein IRJ41_005348 [Triplophysa rosa]|uniref:Ig-like domain-containing protein n=1 Tax=Triplophysa rosa TaxID=992332 RepID=A0A9W7T589_TRIRA|nr:hypothetical protein IRJ41_005348 [Triplophysa rosa]